MKDHWCIEWVGNGIEDILRNGTGDLGWNQVVEDAWYHPSKFILFLKAHLIQGTATTSRRLTVPQGLKPQIFNMCH